MTLTRLVLKNLSRNKKRTTLTALSVFVAMFLFSSLIGVLDTLEDSIRVGSETRLVTRNAISIVFPLPLSYLERLKQTQGVKSVTISSWFGGQDPQDPKRFFPQFAVDAETFFPMYARDLEIVASDASAPSGAVPEGVDPKLGSFFAEQTAAVVGEELMKKMGWKLGQTITLNGTFYPGSWPFTIRAVYKPQDKAFGAETMYFHWKYLYEKSDRTAQAGIYILELEHPHQAASIAKTVDGMFENSDAQTRTETERAFQAGFVQLYGNLPFVLRLIGFAVVFAILLVAANTMMMAIRERTNEIGVLKTLGFTDLTIFVAIVAEAGLITVSGGLLGALLAKFLIEASGFNAGGVLPPMSVHWSTVLTAVGIAAFVGAISGVIPAARAVRLQIVDALRRVE